MRQGIKRAGELLSALIAVASVVSCGAETAAPPTEEPAAQMQLAITSTPPQALAGSVLPAVTVEIRDGAGARVTSAANPVTLAIGTNPGNATLGGTTTVNAVSGVSTFSDLTISAAGNGYTLVASASGMTAATSAAFEILPALPQFSAVAMDVNGLVGENVTIAMGAEGRVHLSYYDDASDDLKYATCASACATLANWQSTAVQTLGGPGRWSSVGVETTGRVHVAYFGPNSKNDLGYATCAANCAVAANWDTVTVDSAGLAGRDVDLAVDGTGRLHVSYQSGIEDLYYATCATGCTTMANWAVVAVDTAGTQAEFPTSIAVAPDGRVHIAYYDGGNADVKYATCATGCEAATSWQVTTIAQNGDVGRSLSIALDGGGRAHLSYRHADTGAIWYATCAATCTVLANWQSLAIHTGGASYNALALDGSGGVHVAFSWAQGTTRAVRYARCLKNCSQGANWFTGQVEQSTSNTIGWFVSLALTSGGQPRMAYMDVTQSQLRYAQ